MSLKKSLLWFIISLPVCVLIRILQIVYTIEYSNGFYIVGKEFFGNGALILIALICVVFVVLSFKCEDTIENPPKSRALSAVTSLIVAISLIGESFGENMPITMPAGQVLILKMATIFTAVYFIIFSLESFTEFKLPAILHVVPCVYAIVKTIFTFINISSLALVSDNILLIAGYCVLMLFFINRAKLYNGIDKQNVLKKISAFGMVSAIICITLSLSGIIINISSNNPYLHTDGAVMKTLLSFGIFIVVFLFETVNKKEHI